MRQFHHILADFKPLVEIYVLDARRLPSGRAEVRLNVLVHPETSAKLIRAMHAELWACMAQADLAEVCRDFDLEDCIDRVISWSPLVQAFGGHTS